MTGTTTLILIFGLLAVVLAALIRGNRGIDAISAIALLALVKISAPSAIFLIISTVLIPFLLARRWATDNRGLVACFSSLMLLCGLGITRAEDSVIWIGVSYFVLRHIHVIVDWWLGRLQAPTVPDYIRYQFFLPVLVAGPINRFPNFKRELSRRRVTAESVFVGLERILMGLGSIVIVSNWGLRRLADFAEASVVELPSFTQYWVSGIFDWLQIFFSFGGYSAIAIGLARVAGMTLEENFNAPWRSTDLVDFWKRWHMTLSSFVRDYLHGPVAAHFRLPALGAMVSMVAMGLWHDFTVYYVLWGLWQGMGIALTQFVLARQPEFPPWMLRLSVPLWLTLTKPVINLLIDSM